MNRDNGLPKTKELILFPQESTYSIGNVTYRVASHFSEDGKSLPKMVERVLMEHIRKTVPRTFEKPPPVAV